MWQAFPSNTLFRRHCPLQLSIHVSDLEYGVCCDTSNGYQYSSKLIGGEWVVEDDKTTHNGDTELGVANHVVAESVVAKEVCQQ